MKQFWLLLNLYYRFGVMLFCFIIKPILFFYFIFLPKLLNNIIKNLLSFWKITNYGDSYWFLFSNKKVIYEALFI